jgi:hypothetical protein
MSQSTKRRLLNELRALVAAVDNAVADQDFQLCLSRQWALLHRIDGAKQTIKFFEGKETEECKSQTKSS